MTNQNLDTQNVPTGLALRYETALKATESVLAPSDTVTVDGTSLTRDQLAQRLRDFAAPHDAVKTLRGELKRQTATRRQQDVQGREFLNGLKKGIASKLGEKSSGYASFGFKSPKKAALSTAAKVVRAAKTRLTRAARHTMGPKQKAGVTGSLPAGVIVAADGTLVAPPANGAVAKQAS